MNRSIATPARLFPAVFALLCAPLAASAQQADAEIALTTPNGAAITPVLAVSGPDPVRALAPIVLDSVALREGEIAPLPIEAPAVVALIGGLIGTSTGFFGGAYAGEKLDWDLGANVGMALLLPVSLRLVDGDRDLKSMMIASSAATALAYVARQSGFLKADYFHVLTPALQITAAMTVPRLW